MAINPGALWVLLVIAGFAIGYFAGKAANKTPVIGKVKIGSSDEGTWLGFAFAPDAEKILMAESQVSFLVDKEGL